jgi:acetyltransferase-like isoleucine patch superfamily enzyme
VYKNKIYTLWKRCIINTIGENPYFIFPMDIIGGKYICIGKNFSSNKRLRIEAISKHNRTLYNPKIIIGDNVSVNYDCHIGCINKIIIGNDVLIASKVYITDHFHGEISKEQIKIPPSFRKLYSKGAVIIEDNVWIGEGVCIMPGVTIGKNSIIGANSVVTKNIPEDSVVVGQAGKVIRRI